MNQTSRLQDILSKTCLNKTQDKYYCNMNITHARVSQFLLFNFLQQKPYKRDKRYFGEFRCGKCGRSWMSANSWKDTAQQCLKCNTKVFAHTQNPISKPEGLDVSDPEKKHPQHLCDKCKELGRYCGVKYPGRSRPRRR